MDPATSNSTTSDDPVVTGDTVEAKNEIGTFVVTDEQEAAYTPENTETALEARLDQISTPTQDTKIAGLQEASEQHAQEEKETENLPSIPAPVDTLPEKDAKSVTTESVSSAASQSPSVDTKESTAQESSPQKSPTVSQSSPETQSPQPESYHTISGGPETLKEVRDKNATSIVGDSAHYPTLGMPTGEENTLDPYSDPSVTSFFFGFLLFVNVVLFLVSLGALPLLTALVKETIVSLDVNGTYWYNTWHVPGFVVTNALHFTVLFALVSLFVMFLTVIIDVMARRSSLIAKILFLILILLLLGGAVYMFQSHGLDIGSFIRAQVFKYDLPHEQ
jgi:hypothetical protein